MSSLKQISHPIIAVGIGGTFGEAIQLGYKVDVDRDTPTVDLQVVIAAGVATFTSPALGAGVSRTYPGAIIDCSDNNPNKLRPFTATFRADDDAADTVLEGLRSVGQRIIFLPYIDSTDVPRKVANVTISDLIQCIFTVGNLVNDDASGFGFLPGALTPEFNTLERIAAGEVSADELCNLADTIIGVKPCGGTIIMTPDEAALAYGKLCAPCDRAPAGNLTSRALRPLRALPPR